MTTGYSAGLDSSDVVLSYAEESTWSTLPAVAFQALRMTGEGFSEQKTRTRPKEINAKGFGAHAITTQQQASGTLNMAMSAGTYDDFLGAALNSDFVDLTPITGTDIAVDGTGEKFTSTTSGKFDDVSPGQWIKVAGFANAANNGYHRVTARVTGASPSITVATDLTTESAGASVTISGSMVRNGTSVRTFYFQKKITSSLYFRYAGGYVTSMNIKAALGASLEGQFGFLVKSEAKATSDASTGSVVDAPTGRVIDNVAGFQNLQVNDTTPTAVLQSVEFTVTKESARAQYGLGSSAAQGIGRGTIQLSGKLALYFKDFTYYDLYKSEADQELSFHVVDDQGKGYIFTLPSVTLMNPKIVAGSPDTDLVAEFELEGNAGASGVYTDVLCQIDRFVS